MEIYKDILGYEGRYEVSNYGNIKSLDKYVEGRNCIRFYKGKILKNHSTKKYLFVALYKDKENRQFYIHRLVAQAFIPNPKNKATVNHIDGDRYNNSYLNLEWNTQKENNTHSYNIGLKSARGESNGRSKLTEQQVLEIRNSNQSNVNIALQYNIEKSVVSSIITRRIWKHI